MLCLDLKINLEEWIWKKKKCEITIVWI